MREDPVDQSTHMDVVERTLSEIVLGVVVPSTGVYPVLTNHCGRVVLVISAFDGCGWVLTKEFRNLILEQSVIYGLHVQITFLTTIMPLWMSAPVLVSTLKYLR